MGLSRGTLIALFLVGLILTSGLAVAKARGSPELSAFAPDNEFTPGEDGTLEVYLQNAGEIAYADTSAEQTRVTTARDIVVELSADDDVPLEIEPADGEIPAGNLPEGVSEPIEFPISIDEDAKPGEYEVELSVDYTYTRVIGRTGAHNQANGELNTHLTVVIEDEARFSVVSTSADDLLGGEGTVSLTLTNEGTAAAYDSSVTLQSSSPQFTFGSDESAETFVGNWAPGETRTVSVTANLGERADRRVYPISATVDYENEDGDAQVSDAISFGFEAPIDSRFEIESVQSSLAVGEEGTVSGTLVNTGDSVARNAVLVLSADTRNFEPIETEFAVGDLMPGSSTEFTFDAEVSEAAASGPRQLSFTVRYRDRANSVLESEILDTRVNIGPARDAFAVEPVSASLEAGASDELRLEITNQGDNPVTEISAKLFANAPLSTADDEAFIDRLEPGASDVIVFEISASGTALTKAYPVSLDFQYSDVDGDTLLSDTYQVPVTIVEPQNQQGGLPILPIAVVGLLALAGVGFLLYRRR